MIALRRLARRHKALAALIVAMALLLRLAVPAGYMPGVDHGRITVSICTGKGVAQMTLPGHHGDEGKAQSPCAFADLSLPAIGGADPLLLATLLRYLIVTALLLAIVLAPCNSRRLRPPLRGPPLA